MSFWNWLDENAAKLQVMDDAAIAEHADDISAEFEKEFPDLSWEVEVTDEGPWFFILSADGEIEKFGAVLEAFQNVPKLSNWIVLPFRQPGNLDAIIKIGDHSLSCDDIWYNATIVEHVEHEGVELKVKVRGMNADNEDQIGEAALILVDHAVGEFDSATRIFSIEVDGLDESEDLEASEDWFPLSELPNLIEQITDMQSDEDDEEDDIFYDEEDEEEESK